MDIVPGEYKNTVKCQLARGAPAFLALRVKHGMPLLGKPGPGSPGKIKMGLKHAKGQGAFAALLRGGGAFGRDCRGFALCVFAAETHTAAAAEGRPGVGRQGLFRAAIACRRVVNHLPAEPLCQET